ncbi:MAG TPA: LuxR C-terminal-related transcriptional regulator [Desulfobacteria bacterium]|nr:LuxR C-terminal-related transcriptional regulator [Desulfobacteria bacterium]
MNPLIKERQAVKKDQIFSETDAGGFSYHGLSVYFRGPTFKPGGLSEKDMMASFRFNTGINPLFPYLNAVAERAELHQTPRFIRFRFENSLCVLYSQAGLVTPVDDRAQARSFLDRLMAFLNGIYTRRHEITPNHRLHRRVSVLDILKLLPKTNCGQCGHASCMAFAASLSLQESVPEKCPHMQSPLEERAFYPVYDAEGNLVSTVAININTAKTGLLQNESEAPSHPDSQTPPEMDSENAESANMTLPTPLSARELEVLCILAEGTSNNEISHMLNISPHTVKSHVIHIFNKLGVNDRTQAAVWAARHHLI